MITKMVVTQIIEKNRTKKRKKIDDLSILTFHYNFSKKYIKHFFWSLYAQLFAILCIFVAKKNRQDEKKIDKFKNSVFPRPAFGDIVHFCV